MKKESGFTLVELLVVVAIMGVLAATAMPLYNTFQQRAYGSEAIVTMKQLVEGQIMYMLDNDQYFPAKGQNYQVFKDGVGDPVTAVSDISNALKLTITTKNRFKYSISQDTDGSCIMYIEADFELFKDGYKYLLVRLNDKGEVEYLNWNKDESTGYLFG